MKRLWFAWRALWAGDEHPRVMATVRIALSLVFLYDLLQVWRFHLVVPLWGPADAGGMGQPDRQRQVVELYQWFAADVHTARLAFGVLVVAVVCLAVGLFSQVAALVALLVYAQLARVLPEADRGIDLLIRNVLFLFVFVPSGRFAGLDAPIFGGLERIPAWSRRLLILQIVVMYFTAGIQKTAVAWWPWGGFSALYIVLQDMAVARVPFAWLRALYPATQLLTAATMLFEWLAVFVPLAHWFRWTRSRGGWLRAQFNRLDFVRWWLPLGVFMHLGIAATMQIGIFPWVMLALYPAFFHPDEIARAFRRR
ncbi:hypothetical protein LBMAG42_39900 [Deltaproteobacteria bacterium]|nr:hypothetical protein LBMAG42_39900 [Deltaproteobacteria bacterium]